MLAGKRVFHYSRKPSLINCTIVTVIVPKTKVGFSFFKILKNDFPIAITDCNRDWTFYKWATYILIQDPTVQRLFLALSEPFRQDEMVAKATHSKFRKLQTRMKDGYRDTSCHLLVIVFRMHLVQN